MKKILFFSFLLVLALFSPKLKGQIAISITSSIAPPPLPEYEHPPCPVDGFLWTPGYWGYSEDGYYWVPGVWVSPPEIGFMWTPCYWSFESGIYGWHQGYWGRHIGYYGGVNYGHGYGGHGFGGGKWEGRHFKYNTAVMNVNRSVIHHTYSDRTVIFKDRKINSRSSFNGGVGIKSKPSERELGEMKQHHLDYTNEQQTHQQKASQNKEQFESNNHGKPAMLSVNKVGDNYFSNQQNKVPALPIIRTKPAINNHLQGNNNAHEPFVNRPSNSGVNNPIYPNHEMPVQQSKAPHLAVPQIKSKANSPVFQQPRTQQAPRPQLQPTHPQGQIQTHSQQSHPVERPPAPTQHFENRKDR